jgi:ribosomal protein S18 acetylase RimI-like enzyme
MSSQPTIRDLLPHEAPLLARLAERLFRDTYATTHAAMLDPYCAKAFAPGVQERELAEPGAGALLAEAGGEPAGYAQYRRRPAPEGVDPSLCSGEAARTVEVARFYVDPRFHGTGLAHRLMDAMLARAAADGARTVWLQVAEYNARALAFYARCGFRPVGRVPFDFAGVRENDHVLAVEVKGGSREPAAGSR